MHTLDIFVILCACFMVGNELTVSLFINPVILRLEERTRAAILPLFAALLGKAMPIWYALSLVLIFIEAYFHRHQPTLTPLLIAAAIWIAVIVYSIAMLVPINNRLAALAKNAPTDWPQQHRKWEILHRWRILLLTIAMVFLLHGLLSPA